MSKKILSLYIVALLLIGFFSFYVSVPAVNIEVASPSDWHYYTNNTYVNIDVDILSEDNLSSFIDWNNSLIGYWSFEYTNDTHIFDNSTYINNATCVGRHGTNNLTVGKYGNGSYFNGSNTEYLNCGNDNSLDISSNNITIELWVKEFESSFNKIFGRNNGSSNDIAYSIQQTTDEGYIIAGETKSEGSGYKDVLVIKLDSNGSKLWNHTFGGAENDSAWSLQQTSDGNIVIVGYTESYGAGGKDLWLLKVDSLGEEICNETHGGTEDDEGYSIQENVTDGSYIVAGYTKSSWSAGFKDLWILGVNTTTLIETGALNKTYGGTYSEEGLSIESTQDENYVIAGCWVGAPTQHRNVWLIKTNSAGNIIDGINNTYGGNTTLSYNGSYQVIENTSGASYILIGYQDYNFGNNNSDVWLLDISADGTQELNNKTFGESGNDDVGYSIQQTTDGGYIIAGYTESYGAGNRDLWLIKTTSNGTELWNRTFGGPENDTGFSVQQATDGGYVIAGNYTSDSNSDSDFWVIKTNATGITTESNNNQSLSKKLVGKGTDAYQINLYDGTIYGYINDVNVSTDISLYDLSQYWHHVALTYDGSQIKLYINGILVSNTSHDQPISTNANNLIMGENFSGIIDEVRIWNRALSNDEINISYSCPGLYNHTFTGLAEGNYTYKIHAINSSGETDEMGARDITVDYTSPTSSVNAITPYNQSSDNISISITASDSMSGLKNVTVYYYYSVNNYTWSGPFTDNTNNTPYSNTNTLSGYFDFSDANNNNSGYYRFYSRAIDNASNIENAPGGYDTSCYYNFSLANYPPNASTSPNPDDGDMNVEVDADLSWTCSDRDGDSLTYDVYFEAGDTTPDVLASDDQSGTTYNPGTMDYEETYYWMIIAYDQHGIGTPGPVWSFTTTDEESGGPPGGPTENIAPTADSGGPYTGYMTFGILFDGSGSSDSDGEIVNWSWDFGDGDTGYGETTTHSYSAKGTYTVTLTVTDDGGSTDSDTTYAKVLETTLENIKPEILSVINTPETVKSGDIVTITAEVIDTDGIESVILHYDNGSGHSEDMKKGSGQQYSAEIGPFRKGTLVKYWVVAEDTTGKTNRSKNKTFFVGAQSITEKVGNVSSGDEKNITITDEDIRHIRFKSISKLMNVTLRFEEKFSEELSENMRYNRTNKVVYKYFNIELSSNGTYINESELEAIKMDFTVRKSWIAENNISNRNITLLRYHNNTWQDLTTIFINENETLTYWDSDVPGFSTFAVVGSKVVEKQSQDATDDEPEIPWIIIIGFIISAIAVLLIVLIKGKYIYIETTEVSEEEYKKKSIICFLIYNE